MILTLLVIAIIIFFIYGYVSNYRFVVTNYVIRDKKLCNIVDEKSIVILSDLHNCTFGNNNEKIKSKIDAISPAYIFIVGDMVNNVSDNNNFYARDLVNYLASKYPVIYSDGNHEQGFFADYFGNFCENKYKLFFSNLQSSQICDKVHDGTNFTHLANSYIQIGDVRIYGLTIARHFYARFNRPEFTSEYLEELLDKADKDYYNVLLAHNPMYFKEYSSWGANLVVSGHIHGGSMRLPFVGGVISPQMILFPKYSGGMYKHKKSRLILSRGLGTHTIRSRFFNPPEVVVLQVTK
jgi:predicted MPP superfamily phosphohydrolase